MRMHTKHLIPTDKFYRDDSAPDDLTEAEYEKIFETDPRKSKGNKKTPANPDKYAVVPYMAPPSALVPYKPPQQSEKMSAPARFVRNPNRRWWFKTT
jgi:hypothetical protein